MKQLLQIVSIILIFGGVTIAQPTVSSIDPTINNMGVSESENISILFSEAMNTSTFNANNVIVHGTQRGIYSGSFSSSANNTFQFNPDSTFYHGEIITVTATTGLQNSSNVAMSSPYVWRFRVEVDESGSGVYEDDVTYTSGDSPEDIVVADVDNDGYPDMIVSNFGDASFSVFINNGDGTYATKVDYSTGGTNVYGIAIGDVDADGYLDVVAANNLLAANSNIKVLTNDGDGTFTSAGDYGNASPYLASDIELGDVDGDGDLDLFATFNADNTAGRYLNDGSGAFSSLAVGSVGTQPIDIEVGDIDNDNDLDAIVTSMNSNDIRFLINNGSGSLSPSLTKSVGTSPRRTVLVDLDDDADLDLVTTNHNDSNVSVYINQNTGTLSTSFVFPNNYSTASFPLALTAFDYDADGDVDILNTNGDSISVMVNNGSGVLAKASSIDVGSSARGIAFGDLTRNGEIGIVTSNYTDDNVSVLLVAQPPTVTAVSFQNDINVAANSNITATFSSSMDASSFADSSVVVVGSVTGKIAGAISYDAPTKTVTFNPTNDFKAGEKITYTLKGNILSDIGVGLDPSYSASFVVAASGNGNFTYADSSTVSSSIVRLVNADVDGDGDEDIIAQVNGGLEIFKNTSGDYATFSQTSFSTIESMFPGDLDNDGDVDLIIKKSGSNTITAVENDGLGNFTLRDTTTITSSSARNFILADFTNDGFIDLTFKVGNQIFYVVPGNGDLSFGNQKFTNVGFSYDKLAAGDIDNDGDIDAIGFGGNDSKFEVVLNNNGSTFSTSSSYSGVTSSSSSFGYIPELADLDDDGYLDIIIPHESGFEIVLNDGDGTFGSSVSYSTGDYEIKQVTAFDYDGDGDLDLGMYADDDNDPEDFLFAYNDGNGGFGNQLFFNFPTTTPNFYSISYNKYAFTDNDGDGDLDLVAGATGYSGSTTYSLVVAENVSAGVATAPDTAASSISFSSIAAYSANISWTSGNGARRMVLVKEAGAVDATPVDDAGYSPNPEFGSGSEIGTGNYVIYGGASNSVTITGLDPETEYHVQVFELNGIPGAEKFLTTGAPTGSFTSGPPPTIWSKNDSTLVFTKADNADWALEANQDRITDNLWITRKEERGIFNVLEEFEFDGGVSPSGTMWALGTTDNLANLTFDTFQNTLSGSIGDNIENTDMVVFVEADDLYFDINFSSWTSGGNGGGFSYTRAKGPSPATMTQTFQDSAGFALRFDEGNVYERNVEVYDNEFLLGSSFTIESWVKLDSLGIVQGAMSLRDKLGFGINADNTVYAYHSQPEASSSSGGGGEEGGEGEFFGAPESSFEPILTEYAGPTGTVTLTSADTLDKDEWYHIALTGESGGFLKLYINGVEQDSDSVQNVGVDESYWYFGRERDKSEYLYGSMDEVRIWKTVRSESQIRSYMHRPYSGDVGRLYGYWQFNEGTGTSTFDGVSNREASFDDGNSASWFTSDAPLGQGTVEEASNFQTGTQTIGNAALSMADGFDNPVDIQVTEVSGDPNVFPTGFTSGLGGKYFVINLFGDPGTFSANLTLNYGSGVLTSTNLAEYKLFKRGSNATGAWTEVASVASAVNTSTGEVTWNGITSFSQFMGVLDEIEYDIQLSDGADVIAYKDSTFIFGSDFFDLTGDFADSALTISLQNSLAGNLFIDQNSNEMYDSGTDLLITTGQTQLYTPTGSNKLGYEPAGYNFTTATIKLVLNESADSVSLDFFTVEGDPSIAGNTGENGWYLLANPFTSTIGDLLDQVWTQGAVNSSAPSADVSIYTFIQDSAQYLSVTTDLDTTKVDAGEGLLVYLWEDNDLLDGESDVDGGWPKTLQNYGNPFGVDVSVPVKNVDHDGVSGTSGSEGFVLFGNPYGWPLAADSVIATLKRADELANSYVYRWNPTAKTYQILSSGAINPYESVFIRMVSSGTSASLSFDFNDADASINLKRAAEMPFQFMLSQKEGTIESNLALRFDEKGSLDIDPYDGYYLGTYASKFANLYTMVGDQGLSINNLPLNFAGEKEFPIYLHTTETGSFKLKWDSDALADAMGYTLINQRTGEEIDLKKENMHEFILSAKTKKSNILPFTTVLNQTKAKQANEPIFVLRVTGTAVNNENDLGIPREVELYQNYPNPFNPSSVIRFGVPEQSRVQLEVFDVLGRKVMTLVDGDMKQPGRYNISFNARDLASGMYVYRLVIGENVLTKKMMLIK